MEHNGAFFCYSLRMYHFLRSFGERCVGSNVNAKSQKRYWVFEKSERLDIIITLYNEVKHKIS